ncbi:MAG: L,D-transpeptidase family protein [Acidimicrobiia bacterium]
MRASVSTPRRFASRLAALLCLTLVPIVAGTVVGTSAAGAASSGHDDTVYAFGSASFHGSTSGRNLNAPIVGMAATPNGKGYWLVANDGGVFAFNAPFFGSLGAMHLNEPIVGMAATPNGKGYWLIAGDGGVFCFGDAHFYGSTGSMHLNSPITQMIPGPGGKGYWLMSGDGGVFTFGSARFHGSMGGKHLNAPIIGMAATPNGGGYLLVGSDGGVFTFGNAHFHGSTGSRHVTAPVVGIAADSTGGGYWLATQDGSVYNFGDAKKEGGALRTLPSSQEITQITSVPGTGGYRLLALPRPIIVTQPIGLGATGAAVVGIQQRLLSLGYWLPGVNGVFDADTQQAVWAFQKYENLPRTGVVDEATHNEMHHAVRPVPRSTTGYVIEVDKTRQVLIIANSGHAQWVFNVSTGSDIPYTLDGVGYSAHTPEGFFNIIRAVDGYDPGPLGDLYRPRYFTNTGDAVHGYPDVPPYPASHGCVRVSNAAIDFIWAANLMPIGTTVWVYT